MSSYCFKDEEWERLYPILHARVTRWVCTSRIALWMRQRNEIIEDIVQEAILRTFAYTKRAETGNVHEIDALEKIAAATAYHCYVDAHRRDQRVLPMMPDYEESIEASITQVDEDLTEQAIDNIYYELAFVQVARWIVNFPDKQRTALLTDLANRMYFDPFKPTPLQEALVSVGIDMREYQRPLPKDKQARANFAAHLSLAYKRIAQLAYMHRYALVA